MTAAQAGQHEGHLIQVTDEGDSDNGEVAIKAVSRIGNIHPDLKVGANLTITRKLKANERLSSMGMMRAGNGFVITETQTATLGLGTTPGLEKHLRQFRNGRDLTDRPRGHWLIDLYGLTSEQVMQKFPAVYQHVLETVKPERDLNRRQRLKLQWWIFGEPRQGLRCALVGLTRYIATVETAKHRIFQFLDASILPDHKLVAICVEDGLFLGVLSSQIHAYWALAAGGRLGVGNDPVYSKSRCLDPFPFPSGDTGLTPELTDRIRALAEQIDAHRKRQQAAHPELTLTGLYNVLEKLRGGLALSAKDKTIHEQGLVSVLRTLHDELDTAVQQAYGWSDLGPVPWADEVACAAWTDTLLQRLVNLNTRRFEEEASGTIRWLRPEFQNSATTTQPDAEQTAMDLEPDEAPDSTSPVAATATPKPLEQKPWPATLPEQIKAVADILSTTPTPLGMEAIAAHFKARGRWRDRLPTILDTLVAIGRAQARGDGRWIHSAY